MHKVLFTYQTSYDKWFIEIHPATGIIPGRAHPRYMAYSDNYEEVDVSADSFQKLLEDIDDYHIVHNDASPHETPFKDLWYEGR